MEFRQRTFATPIAATLIVLQVLFGWGSVALAQTTTDSTSTTSVIAVTEVIPETLADPIPVPLSEGITADLQGASSTPALQATFNEQDTLTLAETAGDEVLTLATSTEPALLEPTPDESGTTTDEVTNPEEVPLDEVPAEEIPLVEAPPPPELEVQPEVLTPWMDETAVVISVEELKPEPEYTFAINSEKKFASSRRALRTELQRGKVVTSVVSETIDTPPQVYIDNENGVMTVSGACEDKYYVILLYKKPDDYSVDKRSYVVNRAYPCEGGTFSYDIDALPTTLADGNYYLLVAKMGEDTPWEPITALTEITLARNQ